MVSLIKSAYSFRYGTDTPEALVEAASRGGCQAVILADLEGLYGLHRFDRACAGSGIRPVAGAHLSTDGHAFVAGALEGGWGELCRLVTSMHIPERVNPREAIQDSGRLFALVSRVEAGLKLRRAGWAGPVYLPVPPGAGIPDMPEGFLPLALSPWVYAGEASEQVHRIFREADPFSGKPEPGKPVVPDLRFPVGPAEAAWPGRALKAARELLDSAAPMPGGEGFDPPVMGPDDPERLRAILLRRLRKVYGKSAGAELRLEEEFSSLAGANLCGYFLVFHELLAFCRKRGIAAVARGSAGGSLAARLLGLTVACPIRYGLSFSRFFNPLRPAPPDIDLDIESGRRDEVLSWFVNRWGHRTAAISVHVTFRIRSAVRLCASAAGLGPRETDALASSSGDPSDPLWHRGGNGEILRRARLLEGLPAGIAPHPCGMVISNGSIASRVPVETCTGGLPVTQFDMEGVESAGLLKMDLLGHRGLAAISIASGGKAESLLERQGELPEPVRLLLNRGSTLGVPHVESPAMRGLLREVKVRRVEDVALALALVRPGASAGGGRALYIRGGAPAVPECLRNLLRENRGVMLYQEDVSEAAVLLMGLSPARGDLLRRRLKAGLVPREEVIDLCLSAGRTMETAEKGWELLSGYAGYGFCKAHAVTYAVEACAFAGLKTRFPARAMAAFMAAGGGFYRPPVYIEEARRMGISILPPGVNTGKWLCSETGKGELMLGFSLLKGMGEKDFARLELGRPHWGPPGVRDSGIGPVLAADMARAGCFDELGIPRSEAVREAGRPGFGLFPGGVPGRPLPDYTREYRVRAEMETMGVTTELHPLAILDRPRDSVPLSVLPGQGSCRLWGRVVSARSLDGGAGFLTLEDPEGIQDAFLPSPHFSRVRKFLRREGATVVIGCIIERNGRLTGFEVSAGPVLG